MEAPRPVRNKIANLSDQLKDIYEAFASMDGEDTSQLDFGLGTPKELNPMFAEIARQYQEGLQHQENLRQSVEDTLSNETGAE